MASVHVLIGLGGVGQHLVRETLKRVEDASEPVARHYVKAAYLDFEPDIPPAHGDDNRIISLCPQFEVTDPKKSVLAAAQSSSQFEKRWPRKGEALYVPPMPLVGSTKGGQIRAHGRLALEVNRATIRSSIEHLLMNAMALVNAPAAPAMHVGANRLIVWVVSSVAGGTGSGTFVDVVAMVRDALPAAGIDLVCGLLIDHSVMAIRNPDTEAMGQAALVELERFMSEPGAYCLRDDAAAPLPHAPLARLADCVWVVSAANRSGRSMPVAGLRDAVEPYRSMAAGWLAGFIQASAGNAATNIQENTFQQLALLNNVNARCRRYAAPGYSRLTFPAAAVTEWAANDAIASLFVEAGGQGYDDKGLPPEEALRPLLPHNDGKVPSMGEWLRLYSSPDQHAPFLLAASASEGLAKVTSAKTLRQHLKNNSLLDAGQVGKWLAECEGTKWAAGRDRWLHVFRDGLQNQLEPLERTLRFPAMLEFVADVETFLRSSEDSARKKASTGLSLAKARDAYLSAVTRALAPQGRVGAALGLGWDDKLSAVKKGLDGLRRVAEGERSKKEITEVFAEARREVHRWRLRAEAAEQLRVGVVNRAQRVMRQYSDGEHVQLSKLRQFPESSTSELSIGLRNDLLKKIEEEVRNAFVAYRSEVVDVFRNHWNSVAAPGEPVRAERVEAVMAEVSTAINSAVRRRIAVLLHDLWPLNKVMLAQINADRHDFMILARGQRRVDFLRENFADSAALFHQWLNAETIEEGEWAAKWITAQVERLYHLADPFGLVTGGLQDWDDRAGPLDPAIAAEFRRGTVRLVVNNDVLGNDRLRLGANLPADGSVIAVGVPGSEYELTATSNWGAYPLPLLESVSRAVNEYLVHQQSWVSGKASFPFHTDQRFYTGAWRDDLSSDTKHTGSPDLLYAFALGLELMRFTPGTGWEGYLDGAWRFLAEGLAETLDQLGGGTVQRDLARAVGRHEVASHFTRAEHGVTDSASEIVRVFARAAATHRMHEPIAGGKDHRLWQLLSSTLDVYEGPGGKLERGRTAALVPRESDRAAFKAIKEQLDEMAQ